MVLKRQKKVSGLEVRFGAVGTDCGARVSHFGAVEMGAADRGSLVLINRRIESRYFVIVILLVIGCASISLCEPPRLCGVGFGVRPRMPHSSCLHSFARALGWSVTLPLRTLPRLPQLENKCVTSDLIWRPWFPTESFVACHPVWSGALAYLAKGVLQDSLCLGCGPRLVAGNLCHLAEVF
jgi:hypothetical protein